MQFVFYKLKSILKKVVNQKWIRVKESALDSKLNLVGISTGMKMGKNAALFVAFLFFMKISDVRVVVVNLESHQGQANLERNFKKKEILYEFKNTDVFTAI